MRSTRKMRQSSAGPLFFSFSFRSVLFLRRERKKERERERERERQSWPRRPVALVDLSGSEQPPHTDAFAKLNELNHKLNWTSERNSATNGRSLVQTRASLSHLTPHFCCRKNRDNDQRLCTTRYRR